VLFGSKAPTRRSACTAWEKTSPSRPAIPRAHLVCTVAPPVDADREDWNAKLRTLAWVGRILDARALVLATGAAKASILSKAVEGPLTAMISAPPFSCIGTARLSSMRMRPANPRNGTITIGFFRTSLSGRNSERLCNPQMEQMERCRGGCANRLSIHRSLTQGPLQLSKSACPSLSCVNLRHLRTQKNLPICLPASIAVGAFRVSIPHFGATIRATSKPLPL
jgi:hypothetical protein